MNPLDLKGPDFLLLYGFLFLVVVAAAACMRGPSQGTLPSTLPRLTPAADLERLHAGCPRSSVSRACSPSDRQGESVGEGENAPPVRQQSVSGVRQGVDERGARSGGR